MGQHGGRRNVPNPLGPKWDESRFNQLGWQLLPLRAFLGVTFVYAGLQKLANPNYFHASSPTSYVAQTRALEATSPIAPLLRFSLHASGLFALLIAVGELAVGLGMIAGLWTRLAALGGLVLSLTFYLTVSWSTTPYFYGSDIVFVFAWSAFVFAGAGGVLCLDAWVSARADAAPRSPGVIDPVRRHLLVGARSAALLAVFGGTLGALTAFVGRAVGGTHHAGLGGAASNLAVDTPPAVRRSRRRRPPASPSPTPTPTPTSAPPTPPESSTPVPEPTHKRRHRAAAQTSGTDIGPVSSVPVGQGRQFTDPASGQPAWVLRPRSSEVLAFSAVCTHAGCTVGFDASSNEFVCPCHGGTYSASTGAVISGPPPAPLQQIPARIANNEIWVD